MGRLKLDTLSGRIFVFFFVLILIAQLGSIGISSTLSDSIARQTLRNELVTAERVVRLQLAQNTDYLDLGARVLAADYGFREAMTSRDIPTIVSALDNHSARIHADWMLLTDAHAMPLAASTGAAALLQHEPLVSWLRALHRHGESATLATVNGMLYQIIAVRITAPIPVGTIVVGFHLDDEVAQKLGAIAGVRLSFARLNAEQRWEVVTSNLDAASRRLLIDALNQPDAGWDTALDRPPHRMLGVHGPLAAVPGHRVELVVQKSLDEALAPFQKLRNWLLWLTLGGLALAGLFSFRIARGVTRPLVALATSADRIARGDYSRGRRITAPREIAALSHALDTMRERIAQREARILELATREAHMLDLAYHDSLTGLPNRALFNERLEQSLAVTLRAGAPTTIMLLDLDRFKQVNDTHGHLLGDQLLVAVAQRLRAHLQRGSDVVARLGGDEFAFLLPTATPASAAQIARALLDDLARPFLISDHEFEIGGSLGIASAPDNGRDAQTLMHEADVAMYYAKRMRIGLAFAQSAQTPKTVPPAVQK
ncbi:MAG: diguanylate cyclase domain-containing protein [Thiobacillus sp.]